MPRTPLVVLMGVAGSGKTTVGRALAARLGLDFVDADDLHPAANKARMRAGTPLTDAERWPWLDAVHSVLRAAAAAGTGAVVACSALRAAYRDRLAHELPELRFVHLTADRDVLAARLAARRGHFFGPALLDSQLETLEPLPAGPTFDSSRPLPELLERIAELLAGD